MKKIRLIEDVPVENKHGMKKGSIFKVVEWINGTRGESGVWVIGNTGERVKLFLYEFEELKGDKI